MGTQALADRVSSPPATAPRPRLLLVGSIPPALSLECGGLRCEVSRAESGTAALEAPPGDVVVIALRLPDGAGAAVMRTLLARSPGTLAVVYAAGTSPVLRRRLRGGGAWGVISDGDDWSAAAQVVEAAVEVAAARARVASLQATLCHANRLQLVGQMSAEVAHEVNNTVTFLSSNLRYLEDLSVWRLERRKKMAGVLEREPDLATIRGQLLTWFHADDAEERRCLDETLDGARQIRRIARDLRALSRGCGQSVPVHFSAETAARKALEYAAVKAGPATRVALRVAGDARVDGHPERLVQVLVNLLFNAINALRPDSDGAVGLSVCALGDRVEIAVEDNGEGVAPALREQIFEPFFTTREAEGGTGLGLAICRDIIHEFGGSLHLEPLEPGARFVISLPSARAQPDPLPFPDRA